MKSAFVLFLAAVTAFFLLGCDKTSDFEKSEEVVDYLYSSHWEIEMKDGLWEYQFEPNAIKIRKMQQLGSHEEVHDIPLSEPMEFEFNDVTGEWIYRGPNVRIIVTNEGKVTSEAPVAHGELLKGVL